MKPTILLLSLTLLWVLPTKAQDWCGHTQYEAKQIKTSQLIQRENDFEIYSENFHLLHASKKATKYIIPVVFHVIHQNGIENVSNTAIASLLEEVNAHYANSGPDTTLIRSDFKQDAADCQIEFRLAKIDPKGNCTDGVNRVYSDLTNNADDAVKDLSRWDNKKYLNIWVVKTIGEPDGNLVTLGYAYFPSTGVARPSIDGIIMRGDAFNKKTLTHEIGHYLNLYHTFQGGCGSTCSQSGDRICDTPPTAENNFGCNRKLNSCSNDSPDRLDQIENHMDYSNCRAMFTFGQRDRMQAAINFYRSELVSTNNLKATGTDDNFLITKPIANFTPARNEVCVGSSIDFENTTCSYSANTKFKWYVDNVLTSTELNPSIDFNTIGSKGIALVVINEQGKDSIFKQHIVHVLDSSSGRQAPLLWSFEKEGLPTSDFIFQSENDQVGWKNESSAGFASKNSLKLNNFQSVTISTKPTYSFVSPAIDTRKLGSAERFVKFNYAYGQKAAAASDQFFVYASNDCAENWYLRWNSVSGNMKTTDQFLSGDWNATNETDWAEAELSINIFKGVNNLLLKFVFVSGVDGNNVFVDNIRIGQNETIGTLELGNSEVNIFPNPGSRIFTINGVISTKIQTVHLFDITGRELSISYVVRDNESIVLQNNSGYTGPAFVQIISTDGIIREQIQILKPF